jgi:hypothetical protein
LLLLTKDVFARESRRFSQAGASRVVHNRVDDGWRRASAPTRRPTTRSPAIRCNAFKNAKRVSDQRAAAIALAVQHPALTAFDQCKYMVTKKLALRFLLTAKRVGRNLAIVPLE